MFVAGVMNHLAEYYSDDESPFRRNSEEELGLNNSDKGNRLEIFRIWFFADTNLFACFNC